MICPSCHQEIGYNTCEFCNVKIDITKFSDLTIRFYKNSTWLKKQSNIRPEVVHQFNNEIVDPLHIEQQNLVNQGLSPIEVITLFEELTLKNYDKSNL